LVHRRRDPTGPAAKLVVVGTVEPR